MVRLQLWLETVINFLYFLCVSPFRFKYKPTSGKYVLISSTCSKILPFLIHFFGIALSLFGLYTSTAAISLQNPRCIFHSAVSYSRYIIYYALLFTFWTRRSNFEIFFNSSSSFLSISPFLPGRYSLSNTQAKGITWLLCFLMIPAAIVLEALNYTGVFGFYHYILLTFHKRAGPKNIEGFLGLQGQQAKMITSPSPPPILSQRAPNFTLPPVPPPPPVMSHFDFAFTTVYDILNLYLRVCNHVAVLFCILAAVTLYQAATNFVTSVMKEKDQDKVILKYINFCKFGSCLNKMCGSIVLCTVVCSPPFFIVYFIGTFTNFEYTGPRVIFYSVLYCCIYIVAAEASSKIGEFKEWIIEYGEGDNESQLFAMFVEMSQNPIGLRGMGCFTLTYGFISKMFGTIITFTIILLQFETTPANPITNIACR